LSATENKDYIEALKSFGHSLGMSFQIRDDVLDYEGSTNLIGKPIGGDIKEKKITLPLIYSLNKVSKSEAASVRKIIKNGKDKTKVNKIMQFVKDNDGINYALSVSRDYSLKAKQALEIFPDSQTKLAMQALVEFVAERKN
jgi:octaprenyl-diphosphate synthase